MNYTYQSENDVMCLGDTKQAALFYDRVFLPLGFNQVSQEVSKPYFDNKLYPELTKIEPNSATSRSALMLSLEINAAIGIFMNPEFLQRGAFTSADAAGISIQDFVHFYSENPTLPEGMYHPLEPIKQFRDIVRIANSFCNGKELPIILPEEFHSLTPNTESPVAIITGVPLIDTAKASWEQIIEIRRDNMAFRKLRNLRLFLYSNYVGKNKDFVVDDISRQLDEYEMAAKKHGFELVVSSLELLLNSKSLYATAITAIAGVVLDKPIVIASALATGTLLEIGKLSLNLAKQKHAFKEFEQSRGLAYIFHLKRKLR